jgi:hypothetical protein
LVSDDHQQTLRVVFKPSPLSPPFIEFLSGLFVPAITCNPFAKLSLGQQTFSHMAVLKAGMVDGVSWMTHGTLVFILRGTTVRAGNRPTPLMINNSESQNYLINSKAP